MVLAKTNDNRQLKLDPKNLTYSYNNINIEKNNEGIIIPEDVFGPLTIIIKYSLSETQVLKTSVNITVIKKPA